MQCTGGCTVQIRCILSTVAGMQNEERPVLFLVQVMQSQKTQGFCVADFAKQSDERRSRSKISSLFIWIKEPCVRKSEGLERSKLLGISQTK